MELFIVSQIVFNIVASVAIIILGILFAIAMYHFIGIVKELGKLSKDLHNASDEAIERIKDIIEKLSNLPILSFFLKKEVKKKRKSK